MADIIITVVSGETTNLALAVPGVQGPMGPSTLPSGGTIGQIIVKQSAVNYDAAWTSTVSGLTLQGATSFAVGSAGSPSLTFSGDTNTGIYSPGADQVAISTNGTGRLFVDASGNVVLAPVTARAQFHVYGTGQTTANLTDAGARGGFLRVSDAGSAAGSGGGLIFSNVQGDGANSIGFAAIKGLLTDGSNNTLGDLAFSTRTTNAATALQERMRLTSDGRLGLGTSSPWNNQTIFGQGTAGDLTTARQFGIGASSTYQLAVGYYQTAAANPFAGVLQALDNDSGTRLLLNPSGGNVGIGTTSPGANLTVQGFSSYRGNTYTVASFAANSTLAPLNVIQGITGTHPTISAGQNSTGTWAPLAFATSDTFRMLIDSSGNVGIGTPSPGSLLNLAHPTASDIRLTVAGTLIGNIYGSASDLNVYAVANVPLTFATNNAERARIDSSGRLLVGTSTSQGNGGSFQIGGSSSSGAAPTAELNAFGFDGRLRLTRATTGSPITIVASGDRMGRIAFDGYDGAAYREAALIAGEVDGTPGTNDMPGRLVFSTTADGAGSPTERMRITSDGIQAYNQLAPAAVNATATLTVANLKAGIITSTSAAATDMTLPTGTDTQAGFNGSYDNMTFEWSVINTGPSLVRVLAGTAHTVVGSGSVATSTSGRFASRRTASNTFVTYRLS